jgi:hypothetical protein
MDILMIDGDRSVLSLVGAMTPDLGRCADNSIQWFGRFAPLRPYLHLMKIHPSLPLGGISERERLHAKPSHA